MKKSVLCSLYGIDYELNKDIICGMSPYDLISRIYYLKDYNEEVVLDDGKLNELFSYSDVNLCIYTGFKNKKEFIKYYCQNYMKQLIDSANGINSSNIKIIKLKYKEENK